MLQPYGRAFGRLITNFVNPEENVMNWKRVVLLTVAAVFVLLAVCATLALQERPARAALGERRLARGAAGPVEYFVLGSGPTVVLLPSFARSSSDFNELALTLSRAGYRIIAVQSRGVGGSALGRFGATLHDFARDIVAVLDAERADAPVTIVGHAFGNRVARAVATDFPNRVERLVLLSGGGEVPAPSEAGRAVGTAVFGFWSARARRDAVGNAFFADPNNVPPHWQNGWYPLTALVQTRATALTPFAEWGEGGNAPVLIVQANADRLAPAAIAHRMVERHPTRVIWRQMDAAGHAMLPEQPERVAYEVLAFMQAPGRLAAPHCAGSVTASAPPSKKSCAL